MELEEMKSLWLRDEDKLDRVISLSRSTLQAILEQKLSSVLTPIYWQKVIEFVFHGAALALLGLFSWYHGGVGAYGFSAYMLMLVYALLMIHCVAVIRSCWATREANDVVLVQSALARIRSSGLTRLRLSVLMIPAILSFPVVVPQGLRDLGWKIFGNFDIVSRTNGYWWTSEAIAFIILVPLGIWFYRTVNYHHIQKAWVRRLINGAAGKRVLQAMVYLKDLEELQQVK